MTTEHTILHKQAFSYIQPQIRSNPQGSSDSRVHKEITSEHQR